MFCKGVPARENHMVSSLLASMLLCSPESSFVLSYVVHGRVTRVKEFLPLGPSMGDSATRWQWPPNNAWPEVQGPSSAFVQLFAV